MNDLISIADIFCHLSKSCHEMPNYIFSVYIEDDPKTKCFYNLIADCFLDIQAYAVLMNEYCWSQAGAVLRIAIEQISSFIVLANNKSLINEYIKVWFEKVEYMCRNKEHQKSFAKERQIKNINQYFDYGWYISADPESKYSRNLIIEKAGLKVLIEDIEQILNKFAHGSLSIFQFNGGEKPWDNMRQQAKRMNNVAIVLFRLLYKNLRLIIGYSKPMPVDNVFYETLNIENY